MQDTTTSRLNEVFRAVLELPDLTDVSGVRQDGAPAWDSLAHAVLVGALESEFGLTIDAAESLELTSYEAVAHYLEERGL